MLFHAHSGLRYLVLLLGALTLLYALGSLVARRPWDRPMEVLGMSFAGSLHLQVLLGVLVIFTRGFYPALIGHIVMMLLAAAAVQVPLSVMRRRPPEEKSHLPVVVGTTVGLVLIAGGIVAIGRSVLGTMG